MEVWHGLPVPWVHHSTGEIAMSAHEVSILIVYPCRQTVPGSHHSREFLHTFGGPKVCGENVMQGICHWYVIPIALPG